MLAQNVAPPSLIGFYSMCFRVLGDCYVTLGSIQLSCAPRSAPQVEQPSTGFTPWNRAAWERRPWVLWSLPQREPGSLAESQQPEAGNDCCCLPFNNHSGPYISWALAQPITMEHTDKTGLVTFFYFLFSPFIFSYFLFFASLTRKKGIIGLILKMAIKLIDHDPVIYLREWILLHAHPKSSSFMM